MSVSGYDVAASAYQRAAELSPTVELRAARLLAAAEASFISGRAEHTAWLLDSARPIATSVDLRTDIDTLWGRMETRGGDPHAACDRLTARARELRHERPDLTGRLLSIALAAAVYAGRGPEALGLADEMVALGDVLPSPFAAFARGASTIVNTLLGRRADSTALDEIMSLARAGAVPPDKLPLLGDIAYGFTILDRFDEATALHGILVDFARERAAAGVLLWPIAEQALIDFRTGRWTAALAGALQAEQLAIDAGLDNETAGNRQLLSLIEAAGGREEDCRRHADQVFAQARVSHATMLELPVYGQLGLLELGLARPERAVHWLECARQVAETTGFTDAGHLAWAADPAEAYVRCGRGADAAEVVARLTAQAGETGRPMVTALAWRGQGLIAEREGFATCFEQALKVHGTTSRPFETARTRLCFGQRLRRSKNRSAARLELRAAWETFAALGADCWARQARDELAATGVTVGATPRRVADLLTPQELQVAIAVSGGISNRQAADHLFVSPKTVEYHLSHVYRKLRIRSRDELAGALAQPLAGSHL